MRHPLKLSKKEKFRQWLELCDFTYKLMQENLSKGQLKQKLAKMRKEHLQADYSLLSKLAKAK